MNIATTPNSLENHWLPFTPNRDFKKNPRLLAGAKGIQAAQKAFKAGMGAVGINHTNLSFKDNWQEILDDAVEVLDKLTPADKNKVVKALAATVANDGVLVTAEHEMLRIVSAMIHVPLPILTQADLQGA